MFGFKKKNKNTIHELIQQDGIDHATQRIAEVICEKLRTKDLAYQFILEELEAASQGSPESKKFSLESGIISSEYNGAMQRSCPEIDGPNGPQQLLLSLSIQLHADKDTMVEFRIKTADNIMKIFELGKYAKQAEININCQQEKIVDIPNLMKNFRVFSVKNGIFNETFEEAYAELVFSYQGTQMSDSFGIYVEKTQIYNNTHDLVQRHARHECSDVESFIYMSNAYTQRAGTFGAMLHGGVVSEVADYYTGLAFKSSQMITFHNKEFQEISAMASYELLTKIDSDINLDGFTKYLACAILNKDNIDFPYKTHHYIEWVLLLDFFEAASAAPFVTPEMLNNFINENKLPNIAMRKQLFGEKIITESCWVDRIIEWADNNSVPDLEWIEDSSLEKGGFWSGLPRENDVLLSLTELNLSGMNIAELPEELSKLIKLESLNISYNSLTKLPSTIGNLSNLKSLDIRCEKLYCVPDSIINLVKLRYLGFYDITHLCDSKLTHEFYMNWIYNLLKEGCAMSMGSVTDMSHIDEKCPPNIMYLRIDQDSWKRAPTLRELDEGQVVETRYAESEDRFIRKAIAR